MINILFISLLVIFPCKSDNKVEVIIEIHAPSTEDTTKIFITGNNQEMGNWQPDKIMLHNEGDHLWRKSFRFKKGTLLEFKITQGSYDNEAVDSIGNAFQNSVLKVTNDTTARTNIYFWKTWGDYKVTGQITGDVRYHKQIEADSLLPRDIIVWLPPGYLEEDERRYPVLYMHDGQNIVDPNTAAFKVDWQIDETADSLIRDGKIEPLIIVGIYNVIDRTEEYTPSTRYSDYSNFVINTVKKLMDETYRTEPGPGHTAVGGSSAGGIASFMLAWEHPDVFSKAICMSPAFKIDSIDYVKNVYEYEGNKKNIQIYIYNGGIGVEEKLQPGIDEMIKALDEKGYQKGTDYHWYNDKDGRHFEAAWAKQMRTVLILFYGVK